MGYPIVLDLNKRVVIVIGGGTVATRKIARLLESGAIVKVISPTVSPTIEQWSEEGQLMLHRRAYQPGDLADAQLVFAATNSAAVNTQVASEARTRNQWSNIADDSAPGDFTLPAIVDATPMQIAIDTGGGGPALSSALRRHLEATLSPGWRRAAHLFAALRPLIRHQAQETQRQHFWRTLANDLPHVAEGEMEDLILWIERAAKENQLTLPRQALQQALQTALNESGATLPGREL